MGNFYILSLLNNLFSVSEYCENFGNVLSRDKIADVISKGKNKYEPALVIGHEINGKMFDIVSGKEVMYSSIYDEPIPNLCYYSKQVISREKVLEELKKLNIKDINKYIESINLIEEYSVNNYLRYKKCVKRMSCAGSFSKVI